MTRMTSYTINNLRCGYGADRAVLHVENLHLPHKGIVFVIGPSGSGKSTLLEVLGLMNNTILDSEGTGIRFFPGMDVPEVDIRAAWKNTETERAHLRRTFFSFLFQSTNLMPHFTAGENMCTSLLIRGYSYDDAQKYVLDMMRRLDLEPAIFNRKTSELSGGQRQRLAFVRACTGSYRVLFGDEPTGNLDPGTSRKLMDELSNQVKTTDAVCIVVSHDLSLAREYADMIVPICFAPAPGGDNDRFGFVAQEMVFVREDQQWLDARGNPVPAIGKALSEVILPTPTVTMIH